VRYLTRFKNPPVILLLVASAISVSTGELANFLIITFIVLLSVTLDFVQEYHAGKADRLGHSVSVRATVMRVSSMFDVLTYYVMLVVLKADEALFQTGWFVESLSTQVLVIFIIRTRGNPLRSRPHPLLAVTSLAIVTIAVLLPFTPLGTYFGFVPLPAKFYAILAAMVITYLAMVQVAKKGFYRWSGAPDERRGTRAMARSPR
jgi:magnesium-transporting ATPase (P-type)